jgi:SAM-dependent methyltransferase
MNVADLIPPEHMHYVGKGDFLAFGRLILRCLVEFAALRPEHRVLDVGCGIGRVAIPLTKYLNPAGSYEGFDIVRLGIDWCTETITPFYPNFHFQLADVYNQMYNPSGGYQAAEYRFPFESRSFDLVFLTSVFTHMLPRDMENYLYEINRVLKIGGRCLTSLFLLNEESDALLRAGKGLLQFPYRCGIYRYGAGIKEGRIAYEETFVRALSRRYGLRIHEPVGYGSWCGREQRTEGPDVGQDVLVAIKRKDVGVPLRLRRIRMMAGLQRRLHRLFDWRKAPTEAEVLRPLMPASATVRSREAS